MNEELAPIVDLQSDDVVATLNRACETAGFFRLHGHGIAPELIDDLLAVATEFFRLPFAEKMRASLSDPEIERGYLAKGTEGFSYSAGIETPPDLVEGFAWARDSYPAGDPNFAPIPQMPGAFAPNVWPESPARMRDVLVAYYGEAKRVADEVLVVMARALDLDPDFFVTKTDHSVDTMRINYFRAAPGDPPPAAGQFGLGPHTDYGIITLLYATPVPGLQVADRAGQWHALTPEEGTLIVNLGDLTAQWTNDRWRSTLHRVVPMAATDEVIERLSIPFFREGNFDNVVECLPSCCSEDNPPRYPPVIGGEHLAAKFLGGRTLEAATAVSTIGDRAGAVQLTP